jgi:hypothetical protein
VLLIAVLSLAVRVFDPAVVAAAAAAEVLHIE